MEMKDKIIAVNLFKNKDIKTISFFVIVVSFLQILKLLVILFIPLYCKIKPISGHFYLSIPPKNIRNVIFSDIFRGYGKGLLA